MFFILFLEYYSLHVLLVVLRPILLEVSRYDLIQYDVMVSLVLSYLHRAERTLRRKEEVFFQTERAKDMSTFNSD
jgi:hypothetical protein